MKAIVVRQPWATLIALGIKTIETRGFQPRTSLAPGEPLAIVAGKAKPAKGWVGGQFEWCVGDFTRGAALHAGDDDGECPCPDPDDGAWSDECRALNEWGLALLHDEGAHGMSIRAPLPLGAVVAVVTYDGALPVVPLYVPAGLSPTDPKYPVLNGTHRLIAGGKSLYSTNRGGGPLIDLGSQLPLGDFTPGRYGWMLSNPQRIDPVPCPAKRPDGSRTVMQGIFTLPDDVLAQVQEQLAVVS